MILNEMNAREVYNEISRDLDKVRFKLKTEEAKARKAFAREYRFPKVYTSFYTVPATRNKYLLWYVASNSHDESYMNLSGYACLIPARGGSFGYGRIKLNGNPPDALFEKNILHVYDYHFVDRYRERILKSKDESIHRAAALMLARNPLCIVLDMKKEYNFRYKKYDGMVALSIPEGLCFVNFGTPIIDGMPDEDEGKDELDRLHVIMYNTILSRSMMKPDQREQEKIDVRDFFYEGVKLGHFSDYDEADYLVKGWTDASRAIYETVRPFVTKFATQNLQ